MEIQNEKMTRIAVGVATTSDPFQSGREAAEAARNALPEGPMDMAIATGSGDASFKDFLEGVRLVVGENALIGIPAPWIRSTDAADNRLVLLVQGHSQRLSAVSAVEKDNAARGATALMTELRRRRGNARLEFDYHGIIAFDAGLNVDRRVFSHVLASEAGIESWIAGFSLWPQSAAPMVCGARTVQTGITALECLTEDAWGLGWVDTSSFPGDAAVQREASRSALREALGQLESRKPAAALLFFSTHDQPADPKLALEAFKDAEAVLPDLPMIAIPVRAASLRVRSGIVTVANQATIAIVIPE